MLPSLGSQFRGAATLMMNLSATQTLHPAPCSLLWCAENSAHGLLHSAAEESTPANNPNKTTPTSTSSSSSSNETSEQHSHEQEAQREQLSGEQEGQRKQLSGEQRGERGQPVGEQAVWGRGGAWGLLRGAG